MVATVLMSLALASVGTGQTPPDPKLVRVWITTEEGGHPAELAGRRESLQDLKKALAKQKKLVALVDKEESADVTIEVKERRVETPRIVFGVGARPGDPPGTITPARAVQLLTVLAWHDQRLELKNKHKPLESSLGWESAADDVAKQIEKWISDHRQRIIDGR